VINNKETSELFKLSRTECGMLVRALTGHWLVSTHSGRLKAPKNDFCRSCRDEEEEETVEHLLCFCPALCRLRLDDHKHKCFYKIFSVEDQLNTG